MSKKPLLVTHVMRECDKSPATFTRISARESEHMGYKVLYLCPMCQKPLTGYDDAPRGVCADCEAGQV